MLILSNFGNQKMDFLTLDKIFVLDNLNIVLDKKYFVQADGWGISLKVINLGNLIYFTLTIYTTLNCCAQ